MKGSWRLGALFGIEVFVHWTFLILIAWVVGVYWYQGGTPIDILWGVALVLAIFLCVLAHEFGHALTARHYGIQTPDITLLPIGGVSRLERMPEEPWQEFMITVAGPAVNVVIAAILFGILQILGHSVGANDWSLATGNFLATLMIANIILVVFNILPAFPMDGGRLLRAVLTHWMGYVRATRTAAVIGQIMAVLFGLAGAFTFNPFLLFIALFVYLGAQQESRDAQVRSIMRGVPVRAAMMTRFRTLSENAPLSLVLGELLAGYQQDFPVVEQGRVVGVLTRGDLLGALAHRGEDVRVGEIMHRLCTVVDENDMLEDTFQRMREGECPALPVVSQGHLVGLINLENVGEWMMIQSARNGGSRSDVDDVFHAA